MSPLYIYMIMNLLNGKIYIGKTNDIKKRWRDHLSISLNPNKKDHYLIHKAIHKYGLKNFQFTIIQRCLESEANSAEQYWIDYYQTYIGKYGKSFGYNLTAGGDGQQAGTLSGEKNPKAKLTENKVIEIKKSNLPSIELARQYGVNRTVIQRIRSGKIWIDTAPNINPIKNNYPARNGESSSRSILTWDIVDCIRKDFQSGLFTIAFLSKKYKTSWSNIKFIITNKTWIKN